jgi:hypothetical protein
MLVCELVHTPPTAIPIRSVTAHSYACGSIKTGPSGIEGRYRVHRVMHHFGGKHLRDLRLRINPWECLVESRSALDTFGLGVNVREAYLEVFSPIGYEAPAQDIQLRSPALVS